MKKGEYCSFLLFHVEKMLMFMEKSRIVLISRVGQF